MPTIRVDNFHRFKNEFTSYGRSINDLYKQLGRKGCHYLLERKFPDKSRVILAYPNQSSATSKFAIKVNPDGSMVQKTNELAEMMSLVTNKIRTITKIYADKTGNKVKEVIKRISFDFNDKVFNKQVYKHTNKYVTHYEYDKYGGRHAQCNRMIDNVRESFSNIAMDGSGNQSLYVQHMDGTKTFTRFIDGVDYSFTTRK